ncbi:MAG: precorrin-3B C(17)-methyltransferase [bacterium]|nr:precorrin-3B C(17)-methyltransferase [bacterium]
MAKTGRIAGGLIAQSGEDYYLVGELKIPCDWAAAGFEDPGEIKALERHYLKLTPLADARPEISEPYLEIDLEGEKLAQLLYRRLVIHRNASVSERLWDLIFDAEENEGQTVVNADWLARMPEEIWEIVRDEVLQCL